MLSPSDLLESLPSRYVVGIDLGTTNSAVCYIDTTEQPWSVRVLGIPQLVAPNQVEIRDTLPSFHYQPPLESVPLHPSSVSPQPSPITGFLARDYGAATPGRLVNSAKSWLCHTGVDRTADLLPWHAASDVERLSPVEVSSRYLAHIRTAWNNRFQTEPLERQDIVLTLPASFDEIARELTIAAAARAGPRVVLIEEPQAAFYAWIYKHQDNWDQLVSPGQNILVCDVGGGTTDFTLIRVQRPPSAGTKPGPGDSPVDSTSEKIQFHRIAVGDHLLLGGDNMDLALAQYLETKLLQARGAPPSTDGGPLSTAPRPQSSPHQRLPPHHWDALLRQSRQVKERMLSDNAPEQLKITLPAAGSKLLGSGLSTTVTRDEVHQLLIDGFMPLVPFDAKPLARRSGFQEFGLPYAPDSAITRYLAAFLAAHHNASEHQGSNSPAPNPQSPTPSPDLLLFNGGVFESPLLRHRLLDCLHHWFPASKPPRPIPSPQPSSPTTASISP